MGIAIKVYISNPPWPGLSKCGFVELTPSEVGKESRNISPTISIRAALSSKKHDFMLMALNNLIFNKCVFVKQFSTLANK